MIFLACTPEVNVEISFGGPSWAISPADFQFQISESSDYCYGAFFSIPTSQGTPPWIIGDTFLVRNFIGCFCSRLLMRI
jgi:hypothetical protein